MSAARPAPQPRTRHGAPSPAQPLTARAGPQAELTVPLGWQPRTRGPQGWGRCQPGPVLPTAGPPRSGVGKASDPARAAAAAPHGPGSRARRPSRPSASKPRAAPPPPARWEWFGPTCSPPPFSQNGSAPPTWPRAPRWCGPPLRLACWLRRAAASTPHWSAGWKGWRAAFRLASGPRGAGRWGPGRWGGLRCAARR